MSESINAFPTLITKTNLLSAGQCEDITNYIHSLSDTHKHNLLEGDGISNYSLKSNILNGISDKVDSCRDLLTRVELLLQDYMELTGIPHFGIDRSWMNIQRPGSKLIKHTHPGSFITGALYIKVDEKSSPIELHTPNPFISYTPIYKETKYTERSIKIQPIAGQLILFPSWLLHGSNIVNHTDERIVISFNSGIV